MDEKTVFLLTVMTQALNEETRLIVKETVLADRQSRQPDYRNMLKAGKIVSRAARMMADMPRPSIPENTQPLVKQIIDWAYRSGPKPEWDKTRD